MAHEDDSILTSPPSPEVARHVDDYSRFTSLFKWGAILAVIIAFIVLMIIS